MGPVLAILAVSASPIPPVAVPNPDIVTNETVQSPPAAPRPPGPNLPASPRNNLATWVTSRDYPVDTLVSKTEGTTGFRLDVNRWGRVADCTVTASSGHALLDDQTCRLVVLRASFDPATDKESKPTNGTFSSRVRWVIPLGGRIGDLDAPAKRAIAPPPFFGKPSWVHQSFTVTKEGRFTDCTKTSEGRMAAPPFSVCDMSAKNLFPPSGPFRDEQGNPVERRMILKWSIEIEPVK